MYTASHAITASNAHCGSHTQKHAKAQEVLVPESAMQQPPHFNLRCRDGVIPASLKIKPPVKSREGYGFAEWANSAFLSAHIHEM